jgi:hypothetical protein
VSDCPRTTDAVLAAAHDEIRRLRSQLAAALAKVEGAERDAGRYRWLQDKATSEDWRELAGLTAEATERWIDGTLSAEARRDGGNLP